NSTNPTTYRGTTSTTATETILIGLPTNGAQVLVIGGTKTTGDTLTVTVFDPQLSGGSKAVNYVVQAGDTLTSIATNFASAITADTDLQAIAVAATASGTVVFINSGSKLLTTYASSTSGGATETLSLASSTSANQYGYNNLNELTSIAAGGATRFEGTANKSLKSATVNSNAANLPDSQKFAGNAILNSGANTIPASVTDGTNTTKTSSYRVSAKGSASSSPTFDANGNMTSDGTNTYEWDAENRLVKIAYPGTQNYSQFTFDPLGRNVKIVEVSGGSTTSTKQFVWCPDTARFNKPAEERDGGGALAKQFFEKGQMNASTKYFYTVDHLHTIREMVDNGGNVQAQNSNDPFGRVTRLQGTQAADFEYAGYYRHTRSDLDLTRTRAYSAHLGRFLSRDEIEESDRINLYQYVQNSPITLVDSTGLMGTSPLQGPMPPITVPTPVTSTTRGLPGPQGPGPIVSGSPGKPGKSSKQKIDPLPPPKKKKKKEECDSDCLPVPVEDFANLEQCLSYCVEKCKTNASYQDCHAACIDYWKTGK
ncbi:MAG: LysM peptidoglycan-binding domain-containing protein, partial [Candidatus Obscuribacterales bacterium]|nr:LysM peptidoglycan-binding domain-containing protein [Candidatus Obscuribacterales bacterium]